MRPDLYQTPLLRADASEVDTCAPPYHGPIRRKAHAESSAGQPEASATRGSGAAVQAKIESAFATDFSAEHIQQGPRADDLGAKAYTPSTGAERSVFSMRKGNGFSQNSSARDARISTLVPGMSTAA